MRHSTYQALLMAQRDRNIMGQAAQQQPTSTCTSLLERLQLSYGKTTAGVQHIHEHCTMTSTVDLLRFTTDGPGAKRGLSLEKIEGHFRCTRDIS